MSGGFDFGEITRSLSYLFATGMLFTLKITALATIGGLLLGLVLAMMRGGQSTPVRVLVTGFVNFMRSIPLILTIFAFYFLVPSLLTWVTGSGEPIRIDAFWTSVIAFVVFEAAYYCEIIRAGIRSIGRGQLLASQALGMTGRQTMLHVVLPQALRVMIPVLFTQTILLFQDVSLVYVLSITDFVGAASKIAERDSRLIEMYLFVAVVYFAISFGLSVMAGQLRHKLALEV